MKTDLGIGPGIDRAVKIGEALIGNDLGAFPSAPRGEPSLLRAGEILSRNARAHNFCLLEALVEPTDEMGLELREGHIERGGLGMRRGRHNDQTYPQREPGDSTAERGL